MAYRDVPALKDAILEGIMAGHSLRKICEADGMPSRHTVFQWLSDDPEFETRYARAREFQADVMDDKILDTADSATVENHQVAKVQIAAYQWRAAKLRPKRYGDTRAVTLTGADGGPIAVKHVEELSELELARIASEGR